MRSFVAAVAAAVFVGTVPAHLATEDPESTASHTHGEISFSALPQLLDSPARANCGIHVPPTIMGFTGYHCPAAPASSAGTVLGTPIQERDARVLRLVVDMDAEFASFYRDNGIDPARPPLFWLGYASQAFLRDANILLVVVAVHEHGSGGPLTSSDPGWLLSELWDFWQDDPTSRDAILLLTGKDTRDVAGAARMGNAGHSDLPHVAFVRDLSHSPLGGRNPTTWMALAILHELGHTLSLTHEMGTCGPQDPASPNAPPEMGCTVMIDPYVELVTFAVGSIVRDDVVRLLQFGELEEFFLRAHAETHLASEEDVPGAFPGPEVGVPVLPVNPPGIEVVKQVLDLVRGPF